MLVCPNHTSHLDAPVVRAALPPSLRDRSAIAAAADVWFGGGVVGPAVELALGAIPFGRTSDVRASLERVAALVNKGYSVIIFPEGTRSADGRLGPLRQGIGLLATQLHVPIVPAHIDGRAPDPGQGHGHAHAPLSKRRHGSVRGAAAHRGRRHRSRRHRSRAARHRGARSERPRVVPVVARTMRAMPPFELGLYTFGDITPELGGSITPQQRLLDVVDEARLADEVGLDVFAVGEHHRADFPISVPAVVLAAIAERTTSIRLSSSVNVLSSDDPVRVFQQFATLDLLSGGRAEIMAGRGSFTESFPLFGYDLHDYDSLFAEKLEMLLAIRASERVTWSGQHRPPIDDRGVYPRPLQDPLPVWVAIGGTPQSAVRAGRPGSAPGAGHHRRPARALRALRRAAPSGLGRRPAMADCPSASMPTGSSPTTRRPPPTTPGRPRSC